jgi:hypothetical protein
LDRFTEYALLAMVLIVAIMTVSAYVGYFVGGNAATDDTVNSAASGSSTAVYYNPFTIEHWGVHGEYVGFFSAGCLGGLLVGYLFPTVFKSSIGSRRKN